MKKILSVLVAASIGLAMSCAAAETAAPAPKQTVKKTAKKVVKKPAQKAAETKDEQEDEPDVTGSIVREFHCDAGHKITVYRNPGDDTNVALRWNNRILRMKNVVTDSGAERLEHERLGLLFIGIPAKAILLDSKRGRQLANECKMVGQ